MGYESVTPVPQQVLTTIEVAARTQHHQETVRRAFVSGELHGSQRKERGPWRALSSCVDAWVLGVSCEHRQNVTELRRTA